MWRYTVAKNKLKKLMFEGNEVFFAWEKGAGF
jgi:hypothetical protein